jgi:hypothetical protein
MDAAMKLQNMLLVLTAMAVPLMSLADTDMRPRSRWMDLISGITQTSRDAIGKLAKLSLYN